MPIHDWTRVNAGLFHHFHHNWTTALSIALNNGGLPPGYFAFAEQVVGGPIPNILTLHHTPCASPRSVTKGGVAIATSPPCTKYVQKANLDPYVAKANQIVIRHSLGNVVAIIEIVSPGNKSSRAALNALVEKVVTCITQGIHMVVIDLFPPTPRDPHGLHWAIWEELGEEHLELPADKPLTLASYAAGLTVVAYVEAIAVGDVLSDMPLFLEPETYVPIPLEATYQSTWSTSPALLRDVVLEAPKLERG